MRKTKKSTKNIEKEISKVCQKIVLEQEIIKMRNEALQEIEQAKAQLVFWDTKIKQLAGSLASYSLMLQKSEKPKSLVLQDNHKPGGKKNEQPIQPIQN